MTQPDYARPDTLPAALRLLATGAWQVLAGGTDIYPNAGQTLKGRVLDLSGLAELSGIRSQSGVALGQGPVLRIGAATTWASLATASLPKALAALQEAARQIGGRQIQSAGTLGGNLCNASPAADGVPALLILDAEVELVSAAGTRHLPLARFLQGPRRTDLRPDEVMTAILIPSLGQAGRSAFVKLGARRHLVISIAMAAARVVVMDGRVDQVALAVGACSAVAARLPRVEAALTGLPAAGAVDRILPGDVGVALSPIDDVRATADYRAEAAVELVRRALAEALG